MNLFSFDPRILILCGGIPFGICCVLKKYQKVKEKSNKNTFSLFVLSVFFFEVFIVWEIILLCTDLSEQVIKFGNYMPLSWALSCFSFSGYIFMDNALNGDVSSKDKLAGKVAFGLGLFLAVGTILFW